MTKEVTVKEFVFEGHVIRTSVDSDGRIWFVAKDVALALEYASSSINDIGDLISHVPEEWRSPVSIRVGNRTYDMQCLTEEGLNFFTFRSDKPKALPFQKWLAGDVLPRIRKTGSYSKELSPAELFMKSAQMFYEQEQRLNAIEASQDAQQQQLDEIQAKVTTTNSDYYTISGYASIKGIRHLDVRRAANLGRKAARLSNEYGLETGSVKDERYGSVKTYHIDVLFEVFGQ